MFLYPAPRLLYGTGLRGVGRAAPSAAAPSGWTNLTQDPEGGPSEEFLGAKAQGALRGAVKPEWVFFEPPSKSEKRICRSKVDGSLSIHRFLPYYGPMNCLCFSEVADDSSCWLIREAVNVLSRKDDSIMSLEQNGIISCTCTCLPHAAAHCCQGSGSKRRVPIRPLKPFERFVSSFLFVRSHGSKAGPCEGRFGDLGGLAFGQRSLAQKNPMQGPHLGSGEFVRWKM